MEQIKRFASQVIGVGGMVIVGSMDIALADPGYVLDSAGKVVTSHYGDCVQTSNWNQELSTPECDPALAARLESERIATELAALESPAAAAQPTLVRLSDRRNVMFEFNSAVFTPVAMQELDNVLSKISKLDQIDGIEIVGHTDSSGPETYNQTLSEQRAASVKQFLDAHGVAGSVVAAHAAGESNPVADNGTRDGRARNRRVDILISGNATE